MMVEAVLDFAGKVVLEDAEGLVLDAEVVTAPIHVQIVLLLAETVVVDAVEDVKGAAGLALRTVMAALAAGAVLELVLEDVLLALEHVLEHVIMDVPEENIREYILI